MTVEELFDYFRGTGDTCVKKFPVDKRALDDLSGARTFAYEDENLAVNGQC